MYLCGVNVKRSPRENGAREWLYLIYIYDKEAHSSGKSGLAEDGKHLVQTDAERHRMTLGVTLAVRNRYFPTDIRFNYEKYWYPHGGAKESERDKLVCEVMIKF